MTLSARLLACSLGALLLLGSCNLVEIPITPPTDRLYFPAGIAVSGTSLAIVSTNQNSKYQMGSVAFIDKAAIYEGFSQASTTPITFVPPAGSLQMLFVPTEAAAPTFFSTQSDLLLLSRFENQLQVLNQQNGKWTCEAAQGNNCSQPNANVYIPGFNPYYTSVDELTQIAYVAYQNAYGAAPKISGESGVEVQYQALVQAFPYALPLSTSSMKMGLRFSLAPAIEANDSKIRKLLYEEAKVNAGGTLTGNEGEYASLENPNSSSRSVVILSGMQIITLNNERYLALGVNSYRPTDDSTPAYNRARLALVPLELMQKYLQEAKTTANIPLTDKEVILLDLTATTQYVEIITFVQSSNPNELILLMTRRGKGAGLVRFHIGEPRETKNRLVALAPTCTNPKDMQIATVSGGDSRVFVTCFGNDTVMSYQEQDLGIIGMQNFNGRGPTYMAVDRDASGIARSLFVTFNLDGSVGVYDPYTLAFRGRIFQQAPLNQIGGVP